LEHESCSSVRSLLVPQSSAGLAASPQPQDSNLGVALPSGVAVFETSLQNRISSTDTSMLLVSTSTRGGGSLSGYQCSTIDEGRSDAEYLCGTLTSAKTVTSLERGLDPLTGTTTNSSLKFAHRVGANVIERIRGGRETPQQALSNAGLRGFRGARPARSMPQGHRFCAKGTRQQPRAYEGARAELWHIIDARMWFVKQVVKDFAGEVRQMEADLERELSQ
jgi:hypothetical protein